MKPDRLQRVNELLRRELGLLLFSVLDPAALDVSAITVTHVITSSDLRSARVLVSIRGHEHERGRMLGQLRHHHAELQRRLAENVILKYTPVLHFDLDHSLENGDRVLNLLSELEPPAAPEPAAPPPAEENP